MGSLGERTARLAEFEPFDFRASNNKALAAEIVESNPQSDQISTRLVSGERQAGGLGECLDVFKLNQGQLIVWRFAILRGRITVAPKSAVCHCLHLCERHHRPAFSWRNEDMLDDSHRSFCCLTLRCTASVCR